MRTLLVLLLLCVPVFAEPWFEAKTQRVIVLTDISDKRARELAVRFEQSRAIFGLLLGRDKVNLAQPLEVIAFKDADDFRRNLPEKLRGDATLTAALIVGGERNYFLLSPALEADLPAQWQSMAHDLAHLFLDGSYPPTQPWFDEGLAEYFASARISSDVEIGGDPDLARPQFVTVLTKGGTEEVRNLVATRFSTLATLASQPWLPLAQLLAAQPEIHFGKEEPQGAIFYAESWLLVHYLLAADLHGNNQIVNCGKYFNLVRSEGVAVPDAVQLAFGMDVATLDSKLHAYYDVIRNESKSASMEAASPKKASSKSRVPDASLLGGPVRHQPLPVGADDINVIATRTNEVDARVRVDEMLLHLPEHRARALTDLQNVEELFPKNTIVHRALGYSAMQVKDYDLAQRDLNNAVNYAPEDPWTRYYLALLRYRYSLANGGRLQNPGVIQQQLYVALSAYAQFPDALDLLGQAYTAGAQGAKAVETMRSALVLAPRNEAYVLHLGQAYTIAEKWDSAQAIFERLIRTASPGVAGEAQKWLAEIPLRKRFGNALAQQGQSLTDLAKKAGSAKPVVNPLEATPEDEAEDARRIAANHPEPDKRPLQFLHGKLLRVDCSKPPAADLMMVANGKTWHMRTSDVSRVVLINTDVFLCNWLDRNVYVNYRVRTNGEGDLSSLELE